MVGTNGNKFKGIRNHFRNNINYKDMSVDFINYPKEEQRDSKAYLTALKEMGKGDIGSIFTPDDVHFEIAKAAIQKGLHLMITKPICKTLKEHHQLIDLAKKHKVLVVIEVHKRYDPVYSDSRTKMNQQLGDFGYFYSYMSQPKFQLETFRQWAGISSDISYYLNSHHVDLHCWAMKDKAVALSVAAVASSGQAEQVLGRNCEDTITLTVQWQNVESRSIGVAVYTASWTDSQSDVHSQ